MTGYDWDALETITQRLFGYDDGSLSSEQKTALQAQFTHKNNKISNEFSGCIACFTDARLLLFPIKSMKGVFAWITCPKVMQQFKTDLELAGITDLPDIPKDYNLVPDETDLLLIKDDRRYVVLEEYAFAMQADPEQKMGKLCQWLANQIFTDQEDFNHGKLGKDVVMLSNDDFKDFVSLSTEVITRTKINNNTGTVEPGALFTEEFLPTESIMYTLVLTAQEFIEHKPPMPEEEVYQFFTEHLPEVIQIGGNATLGKGIIRRQLMSAPANQQTGDNHG